MSELAGRQAFTEHVGEVFRVGVDGVPDLEMTLVEVNGGGAQSTRHAEEAGRRAPFSVLFRGPAEPVLQQATYQLEHESLGAQALFLVPVGADEDGVAYEAVFT